ncbi:hypothetical protein GWI33_006486 [Rhynchophorus ferrugineus]|uniref:Uncharacterized protein n=1 Tax=Rhynchophorus ferrugineus TaxID=354439 RepID=A0A834IL36_RHYFE|nr:hypothetical protein GWI33_006486 [Rhynchophorus ferrugineus]
MRVRILYSRLIRTYIYISASAHIITSFALSISLSNQRCRYGQHNCRVTGNLLVISPVSVLYSFQLRDIAVLRTPPVTLEAQLCRRSCGPGGTATPP